jgi:hypothetical protein
VVRGARRRGGGWIGCVVAGRTPKRAKLRAPCILKRPRRVGLAGKGVNRGERAHGRSDSTVSAGFSGNGERSKSESAGVVKKQRAGDTIRMRKSP